MEGLAPCAICISTGPQQALLSNWHPLTHAKTALGQSQLWLCGKVSSLLEITSPSQTMCLKSIQIAPHFQAGMKQRKTPGCPPGCFTSKATKLALCLLLTRTNNYHRKTWTASPFQRGIITPCQSLNEIGYLAVVKRGSRVSRGSSLFLPNTPEGVLQTLAMPLSAACMTAATSQLGLTAVSSWQG